LKVSLVLRSRVLNRVLECSMMLKGYRPIMAVFVCVGRKLIDASSVSLVRGVFVLLVVPIIWGLRGQVKGGIAESKVDRMDMSLARY
jgi:hypothetical protein